ncbi:MAG: S-layer homology domain-containing protein [Candidatus Gracilibacteria bacterium]|jgi:hypothetical protein
MKRFLFLVAVLSLSIGLPIYVSKDQGANSKIDLLTIDIPPAELQEVSPADTNTCKSDAYKTNNAITRAEIIEIASSAFGQTLASAADKDPTSLVNRAEALKIILQSAGFADLTSVAPNFSDVDTVNDWFAPYTAFALKEKFLSGYSDGSFRAGNTLTRAEACKIITAVSDYLNN